VLMRRCPPSTPTPTVPPCPHALAVSSWILPLAVQVPHMPQHCVATVSVLCHRYCGCRGCGHLPQQQAHQLGWLECGRGAYLTFSPCLDCQPHTHMRASPYISLSYRSLRSTVDTVLYAFTRTLCLLEAKHMLVHAHLFEATPTVCLTAFSAHSRLVSRFLLVRSRTSCKC
jgi:hypothetical protein